MNIPLCLEAYFNNDPFLFLLPHFVFLNRQLLYYFKVLLYMMLFFYSIEFTINCSSFDDSLMSLFMSYI